jgi:hypothetical protein
MKNINILSADEHRLSGFYGAKDFFRVYLRKPGFLRGKSGFAARSGPGVWARCPGKCGSPYGPKEG